MKMNLLLSIVFGVITFFASSQIEYNLLVPKFVGVGDANHTGFVFYYNNVPYTGIAVLGTERKHEYHFVNGQLNGDFIIYDENGNMRRSFECRNGEKDGISIEFFGQKRNQYSESFFTQGRIDSTHFYFNDSLKGKGYFSYKDSIRKHLFYDVSAGGRRLVSEINTVEVINYPSEEIPNPVTTRSYFPSGKEIRYSIKSGEVINELYYTYNSEIGRSELSVDPNLSQEKKDSLACLNYLKSLVSENKRSVIIGGVFRNSIGEVMKNTKILVQSNLDGSNLEQLIGEEYEIETNDQGYFAVTFLHPKKLKLTFKNTGDKDYILDLEVRTSDLFRLKSRLIYFYNVTLSKDVKSKGAKLYFDYTDQIQVKPLEDVVYRADSFKSGFLTEKKLIQFVVEKFESGDFESILDYRISNLDRQMVLDSDLSDREKLQYSYYMPDEELRNSTYELLSFTRAFEEIRRVQYQNNQTPIELYNTKVVSALMDYEFEKLETSDHSLYFFSRKEKIKVQLSLILTLDGWKLQNNLSVKKID